MRSDVASKASRCGDGSEMEYIESILRRTQWNVSKTAQFLDLQRTCLHEKIAALGITRPE
jgi:DNA-binding NtrC family response regulator